MALVLYITMGQGLQQTRSKIPIAYYKQPTIDPCPNASKTQIVSFQAEFISYC